MHQRANHQRRRKNPLKHNKSRVSAGKHGSVCPCVSFINEEVTLQSAIVQPAHLVCTAAITALKARVAGYGAEGPTGMTLLEPAQLPVERARSFCGH